MGAALRLPYDRMIWYSSDDTLPELFCLVQVTGIHTQYQLVSEGMATRRGKYWMVGNRVDGKIESMKYFVTAWTKNGRVYSHSTMLYKIQESINAMR